MRFAPWILVALLAGCTAPAADDATLTPPLAPDAGAGLQVPAWALRDWWSYRVGDEVATYVVTQDLGAAWQMDTDSQARAFQDARDDVSRLGPQRKADLAGSQGDDAVQFFRWPLAAGDNWTTPWDGVEMGITVLAVDGPLARLEARNATGGLVYTYTYDAGARWFRDLRRLAADGTELVRLELSASGRNWTGTAVRWDLASLAAGAGAASTAVPFNVPEGVTDLWLAYTAQCSGGQGGYAIAVKPADPAAVTATEGYANQGPCGDVAFAEVIQEAPRPGQWAFAVSMGGNPADAAFSYEVLQRTLRFVPVG
ncbi:MAG: hypothetical protein QOD77_189 [Thermoplasmata archaeon]|nr:hypothetical protein [Thermoplasmata archaeon]